MAVFKILAKARPICSRYRLLSRDAKRFASDETPQLEPARTRFAPSPTGHLHLGSLRTALFNYLWAKRTGGHFLLRIEDTDAKRTVPDAEKKILEDLRWAGLQWDEGPEVGGPYGPYRQSERVEGMYEGAPNIYKQHALKLVASGHAYRCFCTSEESEARKAAILEGKATSDHKCCHIAGDESEEMAKSQPFAVRMKIEGPSVRWNDLVFGSVREKRSGRGSPTNPNIFPPDDFVILKGDGFPTYHLASVVDDWHMKITHVIRGSEWMKSTPKHIRLYKAFGWEPPQFAHVGLLRDEGLSKMSKRAQAQTQVSSLLDYKVLPEALTNFLVLLGWKAKPMIDKGSEVMSLSELSKVFDLQFNKSNPIVTFGKLQYLHKQHSKSKPLVDDVPLGDRVEVCEELVRQKYTKADFAAVGMTSDSEVKTRIQNLLDTEAYTVPDAWLDRHDYAFSGDPATPQRTLSHRNDKTLAYWNEHRKLDEDSIRDIVLSSFETEFGNGQSLSLQALRKWDTGVYDHLLQRLGIARVAAEQNAAEQVAEKQAAEEQVAEEQIAKEQVDSKQVANLGRDHPFSPRLVRGLFHAVLRQWLAWGRRSKNINEIVQILGYELCRRRIKDGRIALPAGQNLSESEGGKVEESLPEADDSAADPNLIKAENGEMEQPLIEAGIGELEQPLSDSEVSKTEKFSSGSENGKTSN